MSISSRIHDTIENWQAEWKDRLAGWMVSWASKGVTRFFLDTEPITQDMMKDTLTRIINIPSLPPDIKKALEDSLSVADWQRTQSGWFWYLIGILPSILSSGTAFANLVSYDVETLQRTYRLNPLEVITAWRRDKPKYEQYFNDLIEQGWSDERIEALKFFSEFYPAPADLINWQAKEVFEPEMITRYGLDDEFEAIDKDPFYKAGMTDEQIKNFWRAHWEHASWQQVVEMLHRGLMTEAEVRDWFRVVEIPPFWRQKLIDSAYTWPTRVDVRRWWDMRTIDEAELRRLYSGMGYRGDNLENYLLWTKVYTAFPDLIARWTRGWITIDDVRAELIGLGMPAARVEEMIQTKIKPEGAERVSGERDVTKTDIYKGVKQGVITRGEAIELLTELGFDEDEADYLLAINIPVDEEDEVVKGRQLTKTDIINGLKTEVVTEAEARTRLMELRYSGIDADFLLDIFKATIKPPPEPREREASKADIVLAVKKGLLSAEEAYLMLQDIGFTPAASAFILTVRAEASPFSPVNLMEFRDLTQKYRKAVGRPSKPVTEELKKAAAELARVTKEVESLREAVKAEEKTLIPEEVLPGEASKKRDELRVLLHRAEAELSRVQTDYNALVAEWKFKESE